MSYCICTVCTYRYTVLKNVVVGEHTGQLLSVLIKCSDVGKMQMRMDKMRKKTLFFFRGVMDEGVMIRVAQGGGRVSVGHAECE